MGKNSPNSLAHISLAPKRFSKPIAKHWHFCTIAHLRNAHQLLAVESKKTRFLAIGRNPFLRIRQGIGCRHLGKIARYIWIAQGRCDAFSIHSKGWPKSHSFRYENVQLYRHGAFPSGNALLKLLQNQQGGDGVPSPP